MLPVTMTSWTSRSRSRSSGTANVEEDVPMQKTATASAVARVMNVLMVGSLVLLTFCTRRRNDSSLCLQPARGGSAEVRCRNSPCVHIHSVYAEPNMLVRSEFGRLHWRRTEEST